MDEIGEVAFHGLWRPTNSATSKDTAESARVAKAVRAAQGRCWSNARRAILRLAEYAEAGYVEGWAVLDDCFPIEHGWVVGEGMIIDPTLPERPAAYFPGLEFPGRVGIAEFLNTPEGRRCRTSPFYYAFGWGGMASPSFVAAQESAMASLRERACHQ